MNDPPAGILDVAGPVATESFHLGITAGAVPDDFSELTVEQRLFTEGYAFNFFQAVWLLERMATDRRPVGRHGTPSHEALRFRVHQSLSFPPSAIYEIDRPDEAAPSPVMTVAFAA